MKRIFKAGVLRHISVLLVLVVLLALAVNVPAWADPPGTEPKDTGKPSEPDCWGDVTSDVASPRFGQHASDPIPGDDDRETPRQGVGNVSRDDGGQGDNPSDHGAVVGPLFGADCAGQPGKEPPE